MKVIHITTSLNGGAGLCVMRICNSLIKEGIDSRMIVLEGEASDYCAIIQPNLKWSSNWLLRKFQALACRLHLWPQKEKLSHRLNEIQNRGGNLFFTLPVSYCEHIAEHPWVLDADIIHLHWISNFVDYPSFFSHIEKPIVWTLHDENAGLGGFHYTTAKASDKRGLYDKLEKKCFNIKKRSIKNKDINIVAISSMMKTFVEQNELLGKYLVTLIHNGVDKEKFYPIKKDQSRKDLKLPLTGRIFLFSSQWLMDKRKGLDELIRALELLKLERNSVLVCLGGYNELSESKNIDIYCPGFVTDSEMLSRYYSAADYFVMPSFQEAFAQTPLEAMACGTPVIAFPCSGAKDLINDQNGIVCEDFTVEALARGIDLALSRTYNRDSIRGDVLNRFSYEKIAKDYIQLYERILQDRQ